MISLITSKNYNALQAFCHQAQQMPFGCKILSTASAYGTELPFAQFWLQFSDDNEPIAAISKLDSTLTLCTSSSCNYKELKDFIEILDVKDILCDLQTAEALNLKIERHGEIMVYHNTSKTVQTDSKEPPRLKEVYELLCACRAETFTPPEFEPFYLDMSHRIRHGAASIAGIYRNGALISCAMTSAQTQEAAVLSAVAAHPDFQRQGFGRLAVNTLISQLPQKLIFIFRAENENKEFYRSLHFESYGEWAELNLER